ncbi:hypothetical protein Acr_00g0044370 [Actinidia rufa]|uniref:Uncharacterized protein n=1 Tax=Actinidia rufa TaxID=165716 RepID=A0A7J0DJ22_9ERIC|nr:hypothetical protein Acr_00g0044370 [Actinidia rufa]
MLEGNHYLRLRKPNQPQARLVTDSPDKDQYLNNFIWVSGQWEFPAGEPDSFSIPRHRGYVLIGFNSCFWRRSDRCSAAISIVNKCGRSRKVFDLLSYVFLYWYTIPLRATRQGHPILPPLQIHGLGLRPRSSLSDEVSDLFEGDEGLDIEAEVEDGEEVDQVPTAAPLIVEHFYSRRGSSSSRSQGNEEIMAPKVRTLGKGQAPRIEPPMLLEAPDSSIQQVTSIDTSNDHETCVALGNTVMLPQDVADHAAETTTEFRGQAHYAGRPVVSAGCIHLSSVEVGCGGSEEGKPEEVSNLKAFACGEVYKNLFDRAFERAGDVYERQLSEFLDHPAWSSPAPPIQLLASPERYSPIILPDFNEKEYATLLADEGNINTAVAEARIGIEGTIDGD